MKNSDTRRTTEEDSFNSPKSLKQLKTPVTSPFSKSILNLLSPIQQFPSPPAYTKSSFLNPCESLNLLSPVLRDQNEPKKTIQKLDFAALKSNSTFTLNSITAKFTKTNEKEASPVYFKQKRPRKDPNPGKICCNCMKSKCLKLYCDCFAAGVYCDGCNCKECLNTQSYEGARRDAMAATLDRNPTAFKSKIKKLSSNGEAVSVHNKGCNCTKSECLKKYCECFSGGIVCSDSCHCIGCKNLDLSGK